MSRTFFPRLFLLGLFAVLLAACGQKGYHSSSNVELKVAGSWDYRFEPKPASPAPAPALPAETAKYKEFEDNPVMLTEQEPLSTFSFDVDTASYANVRRFLNEGRLPHPDAVRVEELMNYFPGFVQGEKLGKSPFVASYELAPCPWNKENLLLYIALKADDVNMKTVPPANLVFLVDVSGSMDAPERLPLVKNALKMLVGELRPQDKVSMVTYAGGTKVVLQPTSGREKGEINAAIAQLAPGGGTAGASGLALAYEQAQAGFVKGGVNRILLCTDGDFNLGVVDPKEITAMVERGRDKGITLSAFGVGGGNYNDALMVRIADNGNGNYSYVDDLSEARKVLHEEMRATLVTVAKDVKAQIEFNPEKVAAYRLIGYEKRVLKAEDFNNDAVDAGDIGAGKKVTVLYELTPKGAKMPVDASRYGTPKAKPAGDFSDEYAFVKIRWKAPNATESSLVSLPVVKKPTVSFEAASEDMRFAAAVAAYGQKLRRNSYLAKTGWNSIIRWAEAARGQDSEGYRAEFVKLAKLAETLDK